jgi:hypothetical protein
MTDKLELTPQESGAKGGKARARKLTKEQRQEIAREGARARWAQQGVVIKSTPKAICGSADKPLRLANIEIPCYVLDDDNHTRVLVQRGMLTALDMKQGTATRGGGDRLSKFVATKALSRFVSPELAKMITHPILFQVGGSTAYGYEATILADLCEAVLAARKAGALNYQQEHIAEQCEILVRGFARVGIIALVDEATGYQAIREQHALAEILDKFIAKELRPWVRRFPFEFYLEIFRLKGWDTSDLTPNSPKPAEVGKITTDVIYRRIGPTGILKTLKKLTPRNEKGYLRNKLHSWLTPDVGDPKLEALIGRVITVMKLSDDWPHFMQNLERAGIRRYSDNLELPFPEQRRLALPPATLSSPSSPESEARPEPEHLPSAG